MTYEEAKGLRRSDLWLMNKSPAHFKNKMDSPEQEPSPSLAFGIACHAAILEPAVFQQQYKIIPVVDRRTKKGKEIYNEFLEECQAKNLIPIANADYETIIQMRQILENDTLASQFLQGQHETEWYWTDPDTNIDLKCKCDIITNYQGKDYIIDYKTTDSCADGHFERSVNKYGYQFQAGFYTAGINMLTGKNHGFGFIAQEKKPPYACRVYLCSEQFVYQGQIYFKKLLTQYKQCLTTNQWYGYNGTSSEPTILKDYSEIKNNTNSVRTIFNTDAYLYENEDEDNYDDY